MEIIMILVILGVLFSVLTGHPGYILIGVSVILFILSAALTIIFIICNVLLVMSKPAKGRYTRIDTQRDNDKYKVAYYLVNGEEYPCLFPEEGIFRKRFYNTEKECHLLVNRRLRKVFDRYAIITCVLGLACGIGLALAILSF